MKKLFFACCMLLCLHSAAFAATSLPQLSLTIDNVFPALDRASKDTDFLFDASGAEKSCDKVCTAKAPVDKDSYVLISYAKDTGKVNSITFFIQMAYKGEEAITKAMIRGTNAVVVLGQLINPKIKDSDLKKINKRVGIMSEGLVKKGEKHELTYKGVKFVSMFISGSYFLSASFAEEAVEVIPQYTDIRVPLGDDDKFIVKCKTNLPDGTNISVWLYQIEPEIKPLYAGSPLDVQQALILVKDGIVTAWFPTAYEKGLPSGKYDISLAIPQLQPHKSLGEKNSNLGGPDVKVHANGFKGHEFRFGMTLPRNLKPYSKTPLVENKKWPSATRQQGQTPSWSPKIATSPLDEMEETLTWDEMLDKEASKK